MCANSIDTVGKYCRDEGKHLYKYKNTVNIPPLAYVDDLNGIAKCGKDSIDLNLVINARIELKKLRFHVPETNGKNKCMKMHMGKARNSCPSLKVHGSVMPDVTEVTYLGDIICNDGKNAKNVKNRVGKGTGIVSHIMNIINTVSYSSIFKLYYVNIILII